MSGISAKMYSIWNGGIHVESMWSPRGMWGESKDLGEGAGHQD